MLLVEAPQSEARTLAVLAAARELRPGKPLHQDRDDASPLRSHRRHPCRAADGLTIVTHAGNKTFFEQMASRPFTRSFPTRWPSPRSPATVETVDDELQIKDSMRAVGIYHVSGNPHSDTMLMVHLPAERLLIQVDAFSPGGTVNPYAANLLDNVTRRKLAVDRIVPLHGAIGPMTSLQEAAKQGG